MDNIVQIDSMGIIRSRFYRLKPQRNLFFQLKLLDAYYPSKFS